MEHYSEYPYPRYVRYAEGKWIWWNGSITMVLVPILLSIAFSVGTYVYWSRDTKPSPESNAPVTYQIDNHPDRHVESAPAPPEKQKSGGSKRSGSGKKASSAVSPP